MPSAGRPGRWGLDDDWCHEDTDDAIACWREGWTEEARDA